MVDEVFPNPTYGDPFQSLQGQANAILGRRGVQQFAASCRKEGGVVREEIYEAIEHLGIVQVALRTFFVGWNRFYGNRLSCQVMVC